MATRRSHARAKPAERQVEAVNAAQYIRIDMMFEGDNNTAWVHTHGMWEIFQLPELEMVGVSPRFLMVPAGGMMNHIAQYLVDAKFGVNGAKMPSVGVILAQRFRKVGERIVLRRRRCATSENRWPPWLQRVVTSPKMRSN